MKCEKNAQRLHRERSIGENGAAQSKVCFVARFGRPRVKFGALFGRIAKIYVEYVNAIILQNQIHQTYHQNFEVYL